MTTKTEGGWNLYTYQTWIHNAGGSPFVAASGTGYRSISYKETTGYRTPNYFKRVARGELLPFTPFIQFERNGEGLVEFDLRTTTWPGAGNREYTQGAGVIIESWYGKDQSLLKPIISGYSTDPYVQAAAAKLGQGQMDALTFLAELHKTLAMFKGIGVKLLNLIRTKPVGTPWNLWLEGRYGWRTLIFDIQDFGHAMEALSEKRTRRKQNAGASIKWQTATPVVSSDAKRTLTHTYLESFDLSLRGSVVCDFEPTQFQFNPLITAWELIRFSFVIDWFLTVGASLAALSFVVMNPSYVSAGGSRLKYACDMTLTSVAKPGYVYASNVGWTRETSEYIIRTPRPVTLIPQFRLRVDDFKILDLVSLVLQSLRR